MFLFDLVETILIFTGLIATPAICMSILVISPIFANQILTEIVELDDNGDEKYIQLQPTLPLLCRFPESIIPCTMSVQVEFKDVDYSADRQCQGNTVPDLQSSQNCVRDFTSAEWNGILEFPVKATRDFQIDGRSDGLRYLKVGFRPLSSVIAPLWDGYQVEDVDVS